MKTEKPEAQMINEMAKGLLMALVCLDEEHGQGAEVKYIAELLNRYASELKQYGFHPNEQAIKLIVTSIMELKTKVKALKSNRKE